MALIPLGTLFWGAPKARALVLDVSGGGYGFRAPSLRSGPGMTTERLA